MDVCLHSNAERVTFYVIHLKGCTSIHTVIITGFSCSLVELYTANTTPHPPPPEPSTLSLDCTLNTMPHLVVNKKYKNPQPLCAIGRETNND